MNEPEMQSAILLIEDDVSITRFITVSLRMVHICCTATSTGVTGVSLFLSNHPDLILLDLGLPDMDGMEVLAQIRAVSTIPVIIVSARDQEKDIVDALDNGADDYITKPFRPGELLARIRLELRKSRVTPEQTDVFEYEGLVIDFEKRSISVDGEQIHLTPIEYKLLDVLVANRGKVLTHRFLAGQVWGHTAVDDFQFVRVTMANLRRKIEKGEAGFRYILTETGVGYRFVAS
jgi:two-component system, OmpR family, KDP operon response regulator KdpE